eukprot:CAMPEP_0119388808 /NCGR_PEP_ID=MMETSP1334-20130426/106603_1 /TAXON_ID=127549 /ORGANISM="Calcidiscus leptoporus, Strain RCC1130" /LENGTH=97 /DNA_ID=CAMNT_0007410901 /DNA_START=13 /DNA_END=303 /DNA_ORIENTATION=-
MKRRMLQQTSAFVRRKVERGATFTSTVTTVKGREFVVNARRKHTLLSVALPLQVDTQDKRQLSDAQAFQVLSNAIIVELLVTAVWSPTSTSETCPPA